MIENIRRDFNILKKKTESCKPFVFLNNSPFYLKPDYVLDRVYDYYQKEIIQENNDEVISRLRSKVQKFLGAKFPKEIIFTKSSTETINFLAYNLSRDLQEGDEVIISPHEYSGTYSAWHHIAKEKKIRLVIPRLQKNQQFDVEEYFSLFSKKTRIVCLNHVSGNTGALIDLKRLIHFAHERAVKVVVDGVQSTPHIPVNVQDLDADFYFFSGYKLLSFGGIGVLYAQKKLFEEIPSFPYELKAGTQNIAGMISLEAGLDYIDKIGGVKWIKSHEKTLLTYAKRKLEEIPGLHILDYSEHHVASLSFHVKGVCNNWLHRILEKKGIMVGLSGEKTLQEEFLNFYQIKNLLLISFAFYNSFEDIDRLKEELEGLVLN
jgi:cysteine desulfurase/selenocysteine lyase